MEKILLNEAEAAQAIGIKKSTLVKWRKAGRGPAYIKMNSRFIRYSRESITRWAMDMAQSLGARK